MYTIKLINKKETWNNFVIDNFKFYSFLDSYQWGEFNKMEWSEVLRYWVYKSWDNLIWLFLLIFVKAKRWNYFFTPHWPLIKEDYFTVLKQIMPQISKVAKDKWASFLRINTLSKNTKINKSSYKDIWYIDAPMHVHAENTHLLDLTLSEEKLKSNLRKTTRYIINRAIKEWVEIVEDKSPESVAELLKMHLAHANRTNWKKNYSAFSSKYIENLFKAFDDGQITVLNAVYDWFIEARLLTIKFWKTCVYYIWVSQIKNPKFSPAYLLQWSAILKAKKEWCLLYNFWWVSPDSNPKHPIQWVTLFKRGFGGSDYDLLHAQDYIFALPKYCVNYLIETLRRKKRGYYYKKPE